MCGLCGVDCEACMYKSQCKGCKNTCGNPFGDGCVAAELIKDGGMEEYSNTMAEIIDEINDTQIEGLPKVEKLNLLLGSFVNLEYPLANGEKVKFLDDNRIYFGNQLECTECTDKCFGIVADTDFFIICKYGENGSNPELILYKKR